MKCNRVVPIGGYRTNFSYLPIFTLCSRNGTGTGTYGTAQTYLPYDTVIFFCKECRLVCRLCMCRYGTWHLIFALADLSPRLAGFCILGLREKGEGGGRKLMTGVNFSTEKGKKDTFNGIN